MTTHTPGPWTTDKRVTTHVIAGHRGICSTGGEFSSVHDWTEENEANARLIAAAPDLLNGCELAVMMLGVEAQMHRENHAPKKAEVVERAIAVIRAAITKAEG